MRRFLVTAGLLALLACSTAGEPDGYRYSMASSLYNLGPDAGQAASSGPQYISYKGYLFEFLRGHMYQAPGIVDTVFTQTEDERAPEVPAVDGNAGRQPGHYTDTILIRMIDASTRRFLVLSSFTDTATVRAIGYYPSVSDGYDISIPVQVVDSLSRQMKDTMMNNMAQTVWRSDWQQIGANWQRVEVYMLKNKTILTPFGLKDNEAKGQKAGLSGMAIIFRQPHHDVRTSIVQLEQLPEEAASMCAMLTQKYGILLR